MCQSDGEKDWENQDKKINKIGRRIWSDVTKPALDALDSTNTCGSAALSLCCRQLQGAGAPAAPLKVGCKVTWMDSDDDVPWGSVGEITAYFDEEGVPEWYVRFPNGEWHFPVEQLRLHEG